MRWAGIACILLSTGAYGAAVNSISPPVPESAQKKNLNDQLQSIRGKIVQLQGGLVESLRGQKRAQENMIKVRQLIALQREEKALSEKRLKEFEKTVVELESRREFLKAKITTQRSQIHRALRSLDHSLRQAKVGAVAVDEKLEAPRRKVLANLSDRGVKEIEVFRVDLQDADRLESRIQEERAQMAYLIQDLEEQASVLALNQQLQGEFFKKNREERIAQLEKYKRLKESEAQVEILISQFSARVELENAAAQESGETALGKSAANSKPEFPLDASFLALRGKLRLPILQGQIVSQFGKVFDPESKLHVFKKGIEINTSHSGAGKKVPVQSVASGRVAYAGVLPDYGNVTIVEHGDHYYTLFAKLGEIVKKPGDAVAAGELIGQTADDGTPLYFEIRSRNVAVNPLQWLTI